MKNLLKKLHIVPSQSEDSEGSTSSKGNSRPSDASIPSLQTLSQTRFHENSNNNNNPFSAISGWLNSVTHRRSPSPPSSLNKTDSVSSDLLTADTDAVGQDSSAKDPEVEEEYQIQLALELSAREDPEAVQIEAVKQISLGSCPPENTPAEVIAYRYWNYNALSYDDKILDGFYDVYGISAGSSSSKMPSLVDLQGTPVSDSVFWEAVLVNRAADAKLLRLEQKALQMAVKLRTESQNFVGNNLVQRLAHLVSDHMGGPVVDPDKMLIAWTVLSNKLKSTLGSMVLPLGSLKIGLARHRALLFKVLADSVSVPCRLVKGRQYTGSSDVAMNIVKIGDGREYIVDLMADPGTLIPSDTTGPDVECEGSFFSSSMWSKEDDFSQLASSRSGVTSSSEQESKFSTNEFRSLDDVCEHYDDKAGIGYKASDSKNSSEDSQLGEVPVRLRGRSPSWTEGVSSPIARKMKVKDVSQYMIDAAKENPLLAQKLHDVLLESGVVAPPNLFTEIYHEQSTQDKGRSNNKEIKGPYVPPHPRFLPPLPSHGGLLRDTKEVAGQHVSSQLDVSPIKHVKNVPVTAAAAAAAVVASSMVVAATRTASDSNVELQVAAAATATAAALVATTAAVGKQYEKLEILPNQIEPERGDGDADGAEVLELNPENERISDRSTGNESAKSEVSFDDVADCEIAWEDITLGERIGLGSYGEVYRGDWHGTEVAVKKFLDQEITIESLEEFKSEVLIMKRVRHPNVVLFMGAVTRPPHLSIVTEFLPRGSLYRLIHRPNNQLDIRRRLRMALDAARGMNYLHNCTPVIVHRDLKSPNLLVDKNWVVKVCDFGLSRMKHSTFLSSRSTAGTAEWMAPEVLRNEPSDEKCDVFSYGVILWELSTLQQPWGGMNPMQVVGAVGFQHRRLDIPDDVDPVVADIIRKCWQTDPKLRPSFAEIMSALKPLQKAISNSQAPRG